MSVQPSVADIATRCTAVWALALKRFIDQPTVHGVQIGCGNGGTSVWLMTHILTHESAHLSCVEPLPAPGFAETVRPFRHRLRHVAASSSVALRDPSLAFDSVDFMHVDGARSGPSVLECAVLGFRLLKVAGVLIVDVSQPMPALAMNRFLRVYANHVRIRWQGGHVAVQKLPPER